MALLRGINLGPRNRVSMPELRRRLTEAGYRDVHTLLQSGNVVAATPLSAADLAAALQRQLRDWFGLELAVVVRSGEELGEVVARDPLGGQVTDPRRYQVSFLASPLSGEVGERLRALAAGGERLALYDREIYAWHPEGVARSKLWNELAGPRLGTVATTRNWTTVTKLAELARP